MEGRGENAVGTENVACFCNSFFGYQSLHNWQYLLWIEVTLLIVIWVYSKLFINITLLEKDSKLVEDVNIRCFVIQQFIIVSYILDH